MPTLAEIGVVPLPRARPSMKGDAGATESVIFPFAERWSPVDRAQFEGLMRDRVYRGYPNWFPSNELPGDNWTMPPDRQFGPETPGRYPQSPRDMRAMLTLLGLA
jgi:hypothetical protein